jgi:hypothetical protein
MSNGHIDKAEVEAILSGGQPAVNRFVVESVIQLKNGMEQQHELLADHCVEANVRDERIEVLETWRHEQATTCEARVMKLVNREHDKRHDAYIATLGPDQFQSKLVWFAASTSGKLLLVAAGALIATLINVFIYGRP